MINDAIVFWEKFKENFENLIGIFESFIKFPRKFKEN